MDEADYADERIEISLVDKVNTIRRKPFLAGEPGDCDKCGETMPRLVDGWCCRCRDRFAFALSMKVDV